MQTASEHRQGSQVAHLHDWLACRCRAVGLLGCWAGCCCCVCVWARARALCETERTMPSARKINWSVFGLAGASGRARIFPCHQNNFPSCSGSSIHTSRNIISGEYTKCVDVSQLFSYYLFIFSAARFATPKNMSRTARSNERKQQHAISVPSIRSFISYDTMAKAGKYFSTASVSRHEHSHWCCCSSYVYDVRLRVCVCGRSEERKKSMAEQRAHSDKLLRMVAHFFWEFTQRKWFSIFFFRGCSISLPLSFFLQFLGCNNSRSNIELTCVRALCLDVVRKLTFEFDDNVRVRLWLRRWDRKNNMPTSLANAKSWLNEWGIGVARKKKKWKKSLFFRRIQNSG